MRWEVVEGDIAALEVVFGDEGRRAFEAAL